MSDLIERVARALERSLAWDVEQDVYAGELTHEERVKVAQAAIAAIEADRAELVAEIVRWLNEDHGDWSVAACKFANEIEAKWGKK